MRAVITGALIAITSGLTGAALTNNHFLFNTLPDSSVSVSKEQPAGFWETPAVKGYGEIHYDRSAAFQPTPDLSNKIVFKVGKAGANASLPNPALEKVAQVVNLYVAAGVPVNKLNFVVAVNGGATPAMLDNVYYQKIFGTDNPNLKLISALQSQGVKVSICDQAIAWHHYRKDWIAGSVIHTPSALTTVTTLQNSGYAYLEM
ncbi:MAG: DsrE family protein [Pantoea sp.]|uniref:DsrE family protein n=1 Tax=Pantoea TaxID=53335 RepID=UPI00257E9D57|nr:MULTISPECIES: DsrE family protein [Pantoea]MBS6035839.1 DsrE family protein [Pantoea sp.]MDT0175706.1 DsrE family protein [Enterobacter sp. BRE11]